MRRAIVATMGRGTAVFFGAVWLVSGVADLARRSTERSIWFFDFRGWPAGAGAMLLVAGAIALLATGAGRVRSRWATLAARVVLGALLVVALRDVANFYSLVAARRIGTSWPAPLSLVTAAGLALAIAKVGKKGEERGPRWGLAVVVAAWVGLFPLAQMQFFGRTDYRRHADAAVVLGARAYANGTTSDVLRDRVLTACALYREGWVGQLVFSGGAGDGVVSEPEAMRRLAVTRGVPDEAIVLDEAGVNTTATARTSAALAGRGMRRLLVVSNGYHLPRVKLACAAEGVEVRTVPAVERRTLRKMPYLMAREAAAWWAYWARSLA